MNGQFVLVGVHFGSHDLGDSKSINVVTPLWDVFTLVFGPLAARPETPVTDDWISVTQREEDWEADDYDEKANKERLEWYAENRNEQTTTLTQARLNQLTCSFATKEFGTRRWADYSDDSSSLSSDDDPARWASNDLRRLDFSKNCHESSPLGGHFQVLLSDLKEQEQRLEKPPREIATALSAVATQMAPPRAAPQARKPKPIVESATSSAARASASNGVRFQLPAESSTSPVCPPVSLPTPGASPSVEEVVSATDMDILKRVLAIVAQPPGLVPGPETSTTASHKASAPIKANTTLTQVQDLERPSPPVGATPCGTDQVLQELLANHTRLLEMLTRCLPVMACQRETLNQTGAASGTTTEKDSKLNTPPLHKKGKKSSKRSRKGGSAATEEQA